MQLQVRTLDFTGQNIYAGIDTHKKSYSFRGTIYTIKHMDFEKSKWRTKTSLYTCPDYLVIYNYFSLDNLMFYDYICLDYLLFE